MYCGFVLKWLPISTQLFCCCMTVSDKSGWDHTSGELVSLMSCCSTAQWSWGGLIHASWNVTSFNHWHTFCFINVPVSWEKRLCFLCFMMLFCIFIATVVWVLSIKYTFYIKSRFQCLWFCPSEVWILIYYCTLKHNSTLVCVAMQETFGRAKLKNEID
jgi:hypothetical protein